MHNAPSGQRSLVVLFLCFTTALLSAQPSPTQGELRLKAFEQRKSMQERSLLSAFEPQSIGPSVFSCRVTDVEVNPADPAEFYTAYASGGLWHTNNNGTRFKPVFDQEASMTIGDIAVDWKNQVLWVGTGEANSSRSSYAGTGIYRSADGGKTWEWRGLPESHHIGRIILHPSDPNTLWVAVLGHLYSPNPERGVYKTSDGGLNWQKALFIDENTGVIDLCMDPNDANVLYAAAWQRSRRAWNFDGAGKGSGLWKSSDGGNNWTAIAPDSGFPQGEKVGRIGLCSGKKNGKTVLYACLDNQQSKKKKGDEKASDALTKDQLRSIAKEAFLKLDNDKLSEFLKNNDFPEKYDAKKVKSMVNQDKIKPIALVEYLEDANNNLFETDYIGAELYRSEDDGKSWKLCHEEPIEQMHFTYGYYFSNVRCMPEDADQVYMIGFLIIRSEDGGKSWKNINGDNVHVDHHALWLNPNKAGHLINGNDGGINISWDNGESWIKCNNPPVGQFYAITTDQSDPYNVYGGAQDNGVWVGSNKYEASDSWHQSGQYPYRELLGGDGMQIQVDYRDNATVYTGFQFGNYFRINRYSGTTTRITPKHDLGERPLRFNWQTPIHLSRHQQDVLYLGANRLYRSFDRGENWEAISEDLTQGGQAGNVPYGTLTCVHESPLKMGLIYVGSDDGLVQITRDGGESWKRISDDLPKGLWVSRVQASAHSKSRVYVALNGYRWDDFSAYLYVSDDYGKTWTSLTADLPAEPVNVVREDPNNPDLLYVGTDHNVYVSLDRGITFNPLSPNFPKTPVHDLVIQGQSNDLIIGTHGRSMYKLNVKKIQELDAEKRAKIVYLYEVNKKKYARAWGKKQPYKKAEDPELPIWFYCADKGQVKWSVWANDGNVLVQSGVIEARKGVNRFIYNLDVAESNLKKYLNATQDKDKKKAVEVEKSDTGKYYLSKGKYQLKIEKSGFTEVGDLTVE